MWGVGAPNPTLFKGHQYQEGKRKKYIKSGEIRSAGVWFLPRAKQKLFLQAIVTLDHFLKAQAAFSKTSGWVT